MERKGERKEKICDQKLTENCSDTYFSNKRLYL